MEWTVMITNWVISTNDQKYFQNGKCELKHFYCHRIFGRKGSSQCISKTSFAWVTLFHFLGSFWCCFLILRRLIKILPASGLSPFFYQDIKAVKLFFSRFVSQLSISPYLILLALLIFIFLLISFAMMYFFFSPSPFLDEYFWGSPCGQAIILNFDRTKISYKCSLILRSISPRKCCSYKHLLFYFELYSALELGKLAVTNPKYFRGRWKTICDLFIAFVVILLSRSFYKLKRWSCNCNSV